MMKKLLSLGFELNRELMTTLRLATGGVCSMAGLDIDETEDCKVCITESLLLLMHSGYRAARVNFAEDDGVSVRIEAEGEAEEREAEFPDDGISSALLFALAQEVNMVKEKDCLKAIGFRFVKNGR